MTHTIDQRLAGLRERQQREIEKRMIRAKKLDDPKIPKRKEVKKQLQYILFKVALTGEAAIPEAIRVIDKLYREGGSVHVPAPSLEYLQAVNNNPETDWFDPTKI